MKNIIHYYVKQKCINRSIYMNTILYTETVAVKIAIELEHKPLAALQMLNG